MAVLTMIGVGHSEAVEHWNNNAMITVSGHRLLIDAGYTIKLALREQKLTLSDIDAVFVTHVHADHCFGLERMGYECRFLYERKPTLYLAPGIREELWEQTLKGVMGQIGEGPAVLEDFFEVVELNGNGFCYRGVELTCFQNRHTPQKPSYGLCVNGQVLFSGDTRAIPEIIARFDARTILHDCTLADYNPVHSSIGELIAAYSRAQRQRMFLMSYEDCWREHRKTVEREFAGFARQGQAFAL